ncbi:nucleotidyltransferase domain-containing protein [Nodosilinea sp. LEGE 07088]|uniref:nucleotidyltransferase family protein n=1 Tax=Nodosilinea sp. LEGE 07088 TaxID=2777968 RepID=UPI0018826E4E|nr:nucleotidyltransferase domain-containing protein [Nodosilinea sp. LEGE 07088]MBE9141361.1 nucleotidyltransferase domain-containing protein [Nodosilinea sp. LEGE 07088]
MPQASIPLPDIYQRLSLAPEAIAHFCEKWQIIELSLFGSILRDNFRPAGDHPSDVDFLYVSAPEARYGFKFFDMQSELEQLLNRKVDLISKRGLEASRNPLRRQVILESAQVIYVVGMDREKRL